MDTTHDADAEKKQTPPFQGPTPLPPLFSNLICHVFTQARQLGSHLLEQNTCSGTTQLSVSLQTIQHGADLLFLLH